MEQRDTFFGRMFQDIEYCPGSPPIIENSSDDESDHEIDHKSDAMNFIRTGNYMTTTSPSYNPSLFAKTNNEQYAKIDDYTCNIADLYENKQSASTIQPIMNTEFNLILCLKPAENTIGEAIKSTHATKPPGDIGVDLLVRETVIIPPGCVGKLDLGVVAEAFMEVPVIVCGRREIHKSPVSYFLVPRSSISKTPLIMANSIGVIDAGYRGILLAMVRNLGTIDYVVEAGTRLFQIVPISNGKGFDEVRIVETVSETARGAGGFGSTGAR